MLNPHHRNQYTTALAPPPGFSFDAGVATTFSLEPVTLLTVPVHLSLLGTGRDRNVLGDGVAILESLRRLSARLVVFCQRGRLQLPRTQTALVSLLEPMISEVHAPRGGVFHPKLWLLRYRAEDGTNLIRLLVLSRNVTPDRSWDVILQLDGRVLGRRVVANRPLVDLFRRLPDLAVHTVSEERLAVVQGLADDLERTTWELPEGFDALSFHVLGFRGRSWSPPPSRSLAIVSPFCGDAAIRQVLQTTKTPAFLLSRPETLETLPDETLSRFGRVVTLHDQAEVEDGEETPRDTCGLHAKLFLYREGFINHVVLGSANATDAALVAGRNVEVLVDLASEGTRQPGTDAFLESDGLGDYLVDWERPESPSGPDDEQIRQRKSLERLRDALAVSDLWVECVPSTADGDAEDSETWVLTLRSSASFDWLDGIRVQAWVLTRSPDTAVDLAGQDMVVGVELGRFFAADLTGLTGFRLTGTSGIPPLEFGLNLPVAGMPDARDAALLATVIRNREGFLRYLLMLLGDPDALSPVAEGGSGGSWRFGAGPGAAWDEVPLLEELVRNWSRHPERLTELGAILARLCTRSEGRQLIPENFLELWAVFEKALAEDAR